MIRIKATSTLLFVVLLPGWTHFASSQPPPTSEDRYTSFRHRLEQAIEASAPDVLPFPLKAHVIQDWLMTSKDFKDLCLQYESELRNRHDYTPVMALTQTINRTFNYYMNSANTILHVLESIKSVDPIGFNAYLAQNNVGISSPWFMRYAAEFQATMIHRLRLFNMKTNDSYFDISQYGSSTPYNFLSSIGIPSIVRDEIATEYGPLSENSIDPFTDLFSEKMSTTMYRVGTTDVDNYREHYSHKFDDVQILRGTMFEKDVDGIMVNVQSHPICVRYKASVGKVYVYGSVKRVNLDTRQMAIIQRLYPFRTQTVPDMKTSFKGKHPAGGIFAIMYATMVLLGAPATSPIKLNKVWGDETLYMRIHILNMLANRRMALLN